MLRPSLAAGLRGLRRRPRLVLLIYGMDLALAFVLALPLFVILEDTVGGTGFSEELAAGFDVVLWADVIEKAGPVLGALVAQLLWMIPLYLVWKTAARVGLAHALRGDHVRPFWQGVGRYAGRGVLLALLFLLPLLGLLGVVGMLTAVLIFVFSGEVGAFWLLLVIAPTLLITGLAILDLMHDFARAALVIEDLPVRQAARVGLRFPLRHGTASHLYVLWFLPALVLLALPTLLEMSIPAATGLGIWFLFAVQQVGLLARAAVTVGWIGSEVALYEAVWMREAPLIATAAIDAPETAPGPAYGSTPA